MDQLVVDTHAHLDMDAFNNDRIEAIDRAVDEGVSKIVTVGVDLESSKKAIALSENRPEVLAAVGFHPHEVSNIKKEDIASIAKIAQHPRVVAIGELGLDFYRNYSPREAQLQVMKWQLELAVELSLPVIIHCRQAEEEMLKILRNWTKRSKGQNRGVIHCFNSDSNTAQQYLDMNLYISFGAYIGYPNAVGMHNVIGSIPLDRLLVETDSPYLPPQSHRGKRNEPEYLPGTIGTLAEIRGASFEEIARETTQNAHRLFHWD